MLSQLRWSNKSVRGARDMWSWLRLPWFSTWGCHHVPGKWVSLRSRIRGDQDYLSVIIGTAAQFLTLRLVPIGSTHKGCVDSDGPGHAPRYLDVRPKLRSNVQGIRIIYISSWCLLGTRLRNSSGDGGPARSVIRVYDFLKG